jgi:pilus assembly protein CpaB
MKRKLTLIVVAVVIAVVGAAMVAMYVKGQAPKQVATTDSRVQQVKVLTATGTINPGETATQAQAEGKLALTSVPAPNVVSGAVTSVDSMANMVALAPIYPGEQILAAMFGSSATAQQALPVPDGKIAVGVELTDPGRVGGFVTPGSHVAIFCTVADQTGQPGFTRVLVQNAEVLAVGHTPLVAHQGGAAGNVDNSDVENTIVTAALTEFDSDQVTFCTQAGVVSFGLLGRDTPTSRDHGVTLKEVS